MGKILMSDSEAERIRENFRREKEMRRLLSETPEFQEQARIFRTWQALGSIPEVRCPVCGKGKLTFSCGHGDAEGALELARKMVMEHSKETKRVHEEIKKKHPELELIPFGENK